MNCKNCGAELKTNDSFCMQCGMSAENSVEFNHFFIDPNENKIAVLGSSFLRNFMVTGEISNGSCVLSDKRVYFKGKCYNREGGRLTKTVEESGLDVKDITASGFSESRKIGFLIMGWIFVLLAVVFLLFIDFLGGVSVVGTTGGCVIALLMFLAYGFSKFKLFFIAFAGGKLAFKATNYSQPEIQMFQKALRTVIDNYHKNN